MAASPAQLEEQYAQQAQQAGNAALSSDNTNANQYQGQYNNYMGQAGTAQNNLQNYTGYMQGAGSGTNLYNTGVSQAEQQEGFNPATLATATQNLTQSQNAQAALNQAAQSSTGGYGLSGAQLGGYYSSASQPLASQVTAQGNAVGNLNNLFTNALTSGNQYAGAGLQGEQQTSVALNQVYQNALSSAQSAASQMQFYQTLAQQQGSLNASEQANYQAAVSSYQQSLTLAAQAANYNASSALLGAQTTGQNLTNQQTQAAINAAAAKQAAPVATTAGPTPAQMAAQATKQIEALGPAK